MAGALAMMLGGRTPLTISAYPPSISKSSSGGGTVTTGNVTVTATGGMGSKTYAWTKVSGDTFTVNSPTASVTSFSITLDLGEFKTAVYRCTVTDSAGQSNYVDVNVSAVDISLL